MWIIEDIRRTAMILLALSGFMAAALGGPVSAPAVQDDWLDAIMQAVLVEQVNEGPFWGAFEFYVAQLESVCGYLLNGDTASVYRAMDRLMDMLEHRENGIPPEVADRVFDYCYLVTPAKYHDVSRHVDRFIGHQFGTRLDDDGGF